MTKWVGVPLRQEGQPWPGLNTRGGRIDNGTGQLEEGSFNQIINEADVMRKRRGLIRGLNERFSGVVCGLFKYTDLCGRENLIVADQIGIFIRQPFQIQVFQISDAYPFDSFSIDGDPDLDNWRNTADYTVRDDALFLAVGTTPFIGNNFPESRLMRWFKDATNKAYQIRVEYEFDDDLDGEQRVSLSIKGNGTLSSGALLQADLIFDRTGVHEARLFHRAASGAESLILTQQVTGLLNPPSGFFTLKYSRDIASGAFLPGMEIVPRGGTPLDVSATTLNTIEDGDLGQVSSIGLGYRATLPDDLQIKVVDGGPI